MSAKNIGLLCPGFFYEICPATSSPGDLVSFKVNISDTSTCVKGMAQRIYYLRTVTLLLKSET